MEKQNQSDPQLSRAQSAADPVAETSSGATMSAPAFQLAAADDSPPAIATNGLLNSHTTTGASETTTKQDGAHHTDVGAAASIRMATTDQERILQYADLFVEVGNAYGFPPALLAAISSRETRGRNQLFGDHGNGVGLMQVDIRFHEERANAIRNAANEREQTKLGIEFGATILKEMYDAVSENHSDWDEVWKLRGAITAYNSGARNVQTQGGLDGGTTGNDYSADVWERAKYYTTLEEFSQGAAVIQGAVTQGADTSSETTETQGPNIADYSTADTWDRHSNNRLTSLHPSVLPIARAFINIADIEHGIKLRIPPSGTLRTFAEQDEMKRRGVSQVGGGYSYHNYGLAVDVVEISGGEALWTNPNWSKIGEIGKSLGFEWGGDWRGFIDKPHFQMTFGYTTAQLLGKETGDDGYIEFSEEEVQQAQGDLQQAEQGATESSGSETTTPESTQITTYRVQSGETIQILAQKFNTTVESLQSLNTVHEFNTSSGGTVLGFMAGQEIRVNSSTTSAPSPVGTESSNSSTTTATPEVQVNKKEVSTASSKFINAISTEVYDAMFKGMLGGLGTDEAAIFNALRRLRKNSILIGKLLTQYTQTYKRDLVEDLKSELSDSILWGNQETKALALLNIGNSGAVPDQDKGEKAAPINEAPVKEVGPNAELDSLLGDENTRLSAEQIEKARGLIEKIEDNEVRGDYFMKLQWRVQFNNQRDSTVEENGKKVEKDSGGICNLTALAMCLEYLGIKNPKPEMQYEDALELIRQEQKFSARTGAGWEQVANHLGASVEFLIGRGANAAKDKAWWQNNAGEAMRSGKSLMFSNRGHILRMQSMDEKGIYVDDPYGTIDVKKTVEHKDQKRKWDGFNDKDGNTTDDQVGEDNLWEWEHMVKYKMWWLAAISK